jgi:hypothetical protein
MDTLAALKEKATADMLTRGGELGFADGIIDGKPVLVTAKKVGANKVGRQNHVRHTITYK